MSDTPVILAADTARPQGAWADWAGMTASIGCAIHCAAMPLVLAYLPALGLGWLAEEGFHRWMAVICFALAASAFVPGWRRHGSVVPAVWGAVGLLLLTTSAFALEGSCCTACACKRGDFNPTSECSDVACPPCQSAQEGAIVRPEDGRAWASITPFVTPLGGLLLVVGHVCNHRKTCRCQKHKCCIGSWSNDKLHS